MNRVIIGLGSNIDPNQNIREAKETLAQKFRLLAESCFTSTKPIGKIHQPDFINGTVLIETELSIGQLKKMLKTIESDLGRKETGNRDGPRTIDLDIVVWNKSIMDQSFYERNYLKQSVLELAPDLKY